MILLIFQIRLELVGISYLGLKIEIVFTIGAEQFTIGSKSSFNPTEKDVEIQPLEKTI